MIAQRAEKVFQVIVGARQVRDVVAGEQARPVAGGHRAEVGGGRREDAQALLLLPQLGEQALVGLSQGGRVQPAVVGEQVRRAVDEAVGGLDRRPQPRGPLQPGAHEPEESAEQLLQPPFLACFSPWAVRSTRSSEVATASRRAFSLRPEAANGGHPSSVRALRIARQ